MRVSANLVVIVILNFTVTGAPPPAAIDVATELYAP
jgi:hypothetical protein